MAGDTAEGHTVLQLAAGEMFPLGSLLDGRGAANRYIAATDTFCYLLPATDWLWVSLALVKRHLWSLHGLTC